MKVGTTSFLSPNGRYDCVPSEVRHCHCGSHASVRISNGIAARSAERQPRSPTEGPPHPRFCVRVGRGPTQNPYTIRIPKCVMRRFDPARLVKNIAKNPMKITSFAPARIATLRLSRSPKPRVMSSNLIAPTDYKSLASLAGGRDGRPYRFAPTVRSVATAEPPIAARASRRT